MTPYAAALACLARQRLTEAQLWERLERKGFGGEAVSTAVQRCKHEGFVDDKLYARLYVENKRKAVGDARLVAELSRRGIDIDAATAAVRELDANESQRCSTAFAVPLMFTVSDALLVNKIDYLPVSDLNQEAMRERVLRLNPRIEIFEISAKTGQGVEQWAAWLSREASSFIGSAAGASRPRIGKFLDISRC